jgi:FlaA1/EpsC-like NDP-sugar epimerase
VLDASVFAEEHASELLGRPLLGPPLDRVCGPLRGRRVLVTGAAGSIGVPLAEALLASGVGELSLLDHHEASLFNLYRRFGQREASVQLILADVRDRRRLEETLERRRPQVIVHLAAYKHVPFGEAFPSETIAVNVLGTKYLLELAGQLGVERFVYPSSDKACAPPSLYGATKRLGEWMARRAASSGGMAVNVSRFVNILGTQGSVVETFLKQVAGRQPLGITDRSMTRYWIAMREAVWLLVAAATDASSGQTLMLDARDEVSVVEVAQRVARLCGAAPDGAYPIVCSGARPGERLRERLLADLEWFEPGPAQGLLCVRHPEEADRLERVGALVESLVAALKSGDADTLKQQAMQAALTLQ